MKILNIWMALCLMAVPAAVSAQNSEVLLPTGEKDSEVVVPGGCVTVDHKGGYVSIPVLSNVKIKNALPTWGKGEKIWFDINRRNTKNWSVRTDLWHGQEPRVGKVIFELDNGDKRAVDIFQQGVIPTESYAGETCRRKINQQWKFNLGEESRAKFFNYNDDQWEKVNLPHDWAFENGYSQSNAQGERGGYACGGIGWYRKALYLDEKEANALQLFLDFEAAYKEAEVWINGNKLGQCHYGYLPFSFNITRYVHPGKNIIAVRLDNVSEPSARWYHGCGIYGNVYLRTHNKAFFEVGGTYVHAANAQGQVKVKSVVTNIMDQEGLTVVTELRDAKGVVVAHETSPVTKESGNAVNVAMQVDHPDLWCPEHPNLYTMNLQLLDASQQLMDEQNIRVGLRDFSWSPENGFFLNGQQYKINGMGDHLEGGPTGAIQTPSLLRWKLQQLKDMGCNAIRTAHNPQLPLFYDLCDEIGLLVMDEIFDGWKKKAGCSDYGGLYFATHWREDLRTIVRRDRNHPCVFIYSVGNETRGPLSKEIVSACHEEDSTRSVTSGYAVPADMDVIGINGESEFKNFVENYVPGTQAFVATENPHTWAVRGFYRTITWYRDGYKPDKMAEIPNLTEKEIFTYDWCDPANRKPKQHFCSSYDNATIRLSVRHALTRVRDHNWFSGSFRWTGYDYLGEAGYVHGGWPIRCFMSGALDLAGFKKDLYYLYQSEWTQKDMVHILPHWSHPNMTEGTLIPVWVYTTGDEVELIVNGKSMGRQQKGKEWNKIQCQFMVPWTPGTVEAVAYRGGKEIGRTSQTTAGAPAQLAVTMDNVNLQADAEDVSIISIEQQDEAGVMYPYGENRIHVALRGDARVLSFENGNPVDVETNFNSSSRKCFFGMNRIFVQSTGGDPMDPVSIVLGAISGDKKLTQSDKVSINCMEKSLRGHMVPAEFQIYYTTDGSTPTEQSSVYNGAFSIVPGTTVRAAVYQNGLKVLDMTEKFGPGEGLYWEK